MEKLVKELLKNVWLFFFRNSNTESIIKYIPISLNSNNNQLNSELPLEKIKDTKNSESDLYQTIQFGLIFEDFAGNKHCEYYVIIPENIYTSIIKQSVTIDNVEMNHEEAVKAIINSKTFKTEIFGSKTIKYDASNLYNQLKKDSFYPEIVLKMKNPLPIGNPQQRITLQYYKPSIKELERNIEILANIKQDY